MKRKNLDVMTDLPQEEDREEWEPIHIGNDKSEEDTALVHAFLCGEEEVLI